MSEISRRGLLWQGGATALAAAAAACAPQSAPAAPASNPAPAAPAAKPAWLGQWDDWVAGAKKEGVLNLVTAPGVGFRRVFEAFEQAFPGVKVEHSPFASVNLFAPKLIQERAAGVFSWDVVSHGPSTLLTVVKKDGGSDPIRPVLIHPDVIDDSKWNGGVAAGFIDKNPETAYSFAWERLVQFWVNTDMVRPDEIKNAKDLVDPKWRGKIALYDPRTGGQTYITAAAMRMVYGDGILSQLFLDQKPALSRDERQLTEWLVRGQYAIATGPRAASFQEFVEQGLGKNVRKLLLPDVSPLWGASPVVLLNKAPHPNAAKIFINWLLGKEGQTQWAKNVQQNSRRNDVPVFDAEVYPEAGAEKRVPRFDLEENIPRILETQEIAKRLLGNQ